MAEAEESTQIALFKGKEIRKTIHDNEWWFSVIDIIGALTDSDRARKYWSDLKKKLLKEGYGEVSEKIGRLKFVVIRQGQVNLVKEPAAGLQAK